MLLFALQLVLNCAWSFLFFHFHLFFVAVVDILLLWLTIGACVLVFRRHSIIGSLLLLPYWAWVSFAAALNIAIWQLSLPA